jgi:hypothetical protein
MDNFIAYKKALEDVKNELLDQWADDIRDKMLD